MGYNPYMPSYPHIEEYRAKLQELIEFGGSDNEENIRPAFQNCLDSYCRDHRERLILIPELKTSPSNKPDGTVKDSLRMARGYWEAKDSHDDLDAEIQVKFNRGYPKDNILFEDSQTAVLVQNGGEAMRVDMSRDGELHRLIRVFLDYELPEIQEFRHAQSQFKTDLPTVLENLRATVAEAEAENPRYQEAASAFLDVCNRTIGPAVSPADVREMLLQHILTKDIFQKVFSEDQFHRENNVARQLDALEQTFFTGDVRRQAIDRLRAYYGVIGRAADEIADYAEKQQFLKAIYEDFYTAYNPAAADRLGVVYTPNEVVDFIIRGADHLLQKHFGKTLADDNVQILDPATGTGTFITSLINYLPEDRLEYKYRNEIHANEVAILPYYIANLNIEYTYQQRTGRYLEFPNLCFVDTLDNLDWQGATGGGVTRQGSFNLGGLSEENWIRIQEQNEKPISVIIGNPPYNANQQNENDNNKNREYPASPRKTGFASRSRTRNPSASSSATRPTTPTSRTKTTTTRTGSTRIPSIDRRIRETYIASSTAQKTKQYDMYKRFIRWASDRLNDDGIIAFVSNSAFLDSRQDDGFRRVIAEEFNELWVIDLKGNARTSGERRRQEGGNVFDDKIRVGIAVYFLIRHRGSEGFKVLYTAVHDYAKANEKIEYVQKTSLAEADFQKIDPSDNGEWLNQSNSNFDNLVPLADRRTRLARHLKEERSIFNLSALGVNTARDEWVYDFNRLSLRTKYLFLADSYNGFLDVGDHTFDPRIKWSEGLRNHYLKQRRLVYNENWLTESLYRPFVRKHYFADQITSDRLTSNHYQIFGQDLKRSNSLINFCTNGRYFYTLVAGSLTDWHFTGDTQCLPLYRYTPDGECVSNITEWGLRLINDHYRKEWGDDFENVAGEDGITAEDIFAYTYAVLHDPVYRHDYRLDLLRGFPRLPFYHEFNIWKQMGQELLDLHIGFEQAEPYPLERVDLEGEPKRVILRADKAAGAILLDDKTTLRGIPPEAWEYQLGSRSALEWVLDQYKEKKPKDPTIAERFNTYKFADYKEKVIDLVRRVCTVSVTTMEVVDGMTHLERLDLLAEVGHPLA